MAAPSPPPAPLLFQDLPLARLRRSTQARPAEDLLEETRFTLEVLPHTTVAVLGDEGSGVDSLGGLALALDPVPDGRVLTLGIEPARLERRELLAFRRRVGYLPAGDGLLQNLTLRENIRLPLHFGSNFRSRDIEGKVDVILAQLRLSKAAHLLPAQANDEDRRRAALGRALAFDPELVILEQPFDGLTERVAAELLELARGGEVAEGSRRTVFITGQEIPSLLRPRVDRIVRLSRGGVGALRP
ncbi:MAG TPA: ATP-binding cassette domain-containing protein [Gemmatimonadales bacterium]|jgi:ABC-type transporter Mla maintaining outer membrane lipid asymmetry ATPase subunit MlaF|nr:ATP-binding cassette domain-containing protein [Gemmatimonadales bacterium]